MAIDSLSDVEAFRDFLNVRIESGDVKASVEDCLEEWRQLRKTSAESLQAVREGLTEAKAGLGQPYREVLEELRADTTATDRQ